MKKLQNQKRRSVWEKAVWIEISWLLFLAGCLPLITAGTSLSALFKMLFDLSREKELSTSVFREAYKGAAKNGIQLELIQLITVFPLILIVLLTLRRYGTQAQGLLILIPLSIGILAHFLLFLYAYAYTGYFEQTLKATLKNCASMLVTYTRGTMENVLLTIAGGILPVLLSGSSKGIILLWVLVVLPGLMAVSAKILFRIFRLYDPELNPKMRRILTEREEKMKETFPEPEKNEQARDKGE